MKNNQSGAMFSCRNCYFVTLKAKFPHLSISRPSTWFIHPSFSVPPPHPEVQLQCLSHLNSLVPQEMCVCVSVCATSVLNDYKAQLLKTAIITMPVAKTFWHEFTSSPLRATTHTHTNITQIHVSAHIYSNKLRHTHTLVKAARHTNFSLLARTSS